MSVNGFKFKNNLIFNLILGFGFNKKNWTWTSTIRDKDNFIKY